MSSATWKTSPTICVAQHIEISINKYGVKFVNLKKLTHLHRTKSCDTFSKVVAFVPVVCVARVNVTARLFVSRSYSQAVVLINIKTPSSTDLAYHEVVFKYIVSELLRSI